MFGLCSLRVTSSRASGSNTPHCARAGRSSSASCSTCSRRYHRQAVVSLGFPEMYESDIYITSCQSM